MTIQVEHVCKRFGDFVALDDVTLSIEPGELVALLGPSGSGKTTLLRVIAGLESPDRGRILFDAEDATAKHVQDRQVGFVFQHYALFRHMTVFENVAFGLRVRPRKERFADAEIRKRVHRLLDLVQLDWLGDRYPHQLSGGQRQRIALARALAIEPRVLLLDEPFGALDAKVRKDLRRWLRRLHDEIHLTSVFVTHDQEEALEVADRIVVFNQGKVEQIGVPGEVYDHPNSAFVYGFLGHANRFDADVRGATAKIGQATLATPEFSGHAPAHGVAYVRPHDLDVVADPTPATVAATLKHCVVLGPSVWLEFERRDDQKIVEAQLSRERYDELAHLLVSGNTVYLLPKRAKVFLEDVKPFEETTIMDVSPSEPAPIP